MEQGSGKLVEGSKAAEGGGSPLDLEELEEFAKTFKRKRIQLGMVFIDYE